MPGMPRMHGTCIREQGRLDVSRTRVSGLRPEHPAPPPSCPAVVICACRGVAPTERRRVHLRSSAVTEPLLLSSAFICVHLRLQSRCCCPRVSASPCLRVPASPRRRISASPRPRIAVSPRPRVSASPRPRVALSPRHSAVLRLPFPLRARILPGQSRPLPGCEIGRFMRNFSLDTNLLILLGAISVAAVLGVILYDLALRRLVRRLWRRLRHGRRRRRH